MAKVKINRREFLKAAGAGALVLGLAPGLLSAAGRNVAPAPAGNPLFTGEVGRYEGVTVYDRGAHLRHCQDAMRETEPAWMPVARERISRCGRLKFAVINHPNARARCE